VRPHYEVAGCLHDIQFLRRRLDFRKVIGHHAGGSDVVVLALDIFPYHVIPGVVGEESLTLRLLAMGVNAQRWKEQDGAAVQ
jgi:hypothetical protein